MAENRQQRRAKERELNSLKKKLPKDIKIEGNKLTVDVKCGKTTGQFTIQLNDYNFYTSLHALYTAGMHADSVFEDIRSKMQSKYGDDVMGVVVYTLRDVSLYYVKLFDACFGEGVLQEVLGSSAPKYTLIMDVLTQLLPYIEYAMTDLMSEFADYMADEKDSGGKSED